MIFDMLMLFVAVSIVLLIITVFVIEEEPGLAIVFIIIGMIFSALSCLGFFEVDYFYANYNSTTGNTTGYMYSNINYYDPYSWVFFFVFIIYCLLFVKAGFNMWKQALETKGEMDYDSRYRRR